MTSQLTSTFKLTLLASIAIHAAATLHWGGKPDGFHQNNSDSTLNIKLTQPARETQPPRQRESGQTNKPESISAPSSRQQIDNQPKRVRHKPVMRHLQSGRLRKTAGDPETGIKTQQQKYIARLLQHLDRHKNYPFLAQRRRIEGTVRMQIQLDNHGSLVQIHCLTGNSIFCKAASRTAREAAPMPQPPHSLSTLQFEYAMEYKLR